MTSKAHLIRLLEAELDLIEAGGYAPPAGRPGEERPIFDRSLVCINHWEVSGHEADCHDNCILLDAVPEAHRQERLPCHHIPLNDAGETVQSIESAEGRERAQEEVKRWLRTTIERLKREGGSPPEDVRY